MRLPLAIDIFRKEFALLYILCATLQRYLRPKETLFLYAVLYAMFE